MGTVADVAHRYLGAGDLVDKGLQCGVRVGGWAFYFEIKRPGAKVVVGSAQAVFLVDMAAAGALAHEVSSVDQVIKLLEAI